MTFEKHIEELRLLSQECQNLVENLDSMREAFDCGRYTDRIKIDSIDEECKNKQKILRKALDSLYADNPRVFDEYLESKISELNDIEKLEVHLTPAKLKEYKLIIPELTTELLKLKKNQLNTLSREICWTLSNSKRILDFYNEYTLKFLPLLLEITETASSLREIGETIDFGIDKGWDKDEDGYNQMLKQFNEKNAELRKLIENIQLKNKEQWFEYVDRVFLRLIEIKKMPPEVTNLTAHDIQNIIKIFDELRTLLKNQFNDNGSGWALSTSENIIKSFANI